MGLPCGAELEDFVKIQGNGDYQRNVLKYVVFKPKYPLMIVATL
jgi:hypothetical protein